MLELPFELRQVKNKLKLMEIKHLAIFFTFIALSFSNCKIGDDDAPMRDFYSFSVGIELDPAKTEYLSGDLFWMSTSIVGKEFTDATTGEAIKVGNGKFTYRVDIYDPFADPDDSNKFSLAEQTGEVTEIDDFEETGSAFVSFGCPSSNYALQVGVQFLKPGGYLVYLNRDDPFPQIVFTEEDDCSAIPSNQIPPADADIGTINYSFNVAETNKDVFETYAAGFPNSSVDLAAIRKALDEKKAFFVLVK